MSLLTRRSMCALALTFLAASVAAAQTKEPASFEVASIRVSQPIPMRAGPMLQPSGRLYTINLTLRTMIQEANGLDENQVVGGPSWMDSRELRGCRRRLPRVAMVFTPMTRRCGRNRSENATCKIAAPALRMTS